MFGKSLLSQSSGWANIPHCVTQAINTLLDKINANSNEIEELKGSLADLTIKFQVKTSRLDTTVQDHTYQITSNFPQINEDINNLKTKTDLVVSLLESKIQPITETIQDLKSKVSVNSGDIKRESRESQNKLEKLKSDLKSNLEVAIDKVYDRIVSNDSALQKKLQTLSYQQSTDFSSTSKIIESIQESLKKVNLQDSQQNDLIQFNLEKIQNLKSSIKSLKSTINDLQEDSEKFRSLIESLTQPPPSSPSPVHSESIEKSDKIERKKTRTDTVINPIFSRMQSIEESIHEAQESFQNSLEVLSNTHQQDLSKVRSLIETWTRDLVQSSLTSHVQQLKEKLEWLPDSSSSIKGMQVTEARLFLLESRLRSEENQRIMNDKMILDLLAEPKSKTPSKGLGMRRASLSPGHCKNLTVSIEKTRINSIKRRPSSSYQQRDVSSSEKLRERLLVKV